MDPTIIKQLKKILAAHDFKSAARKTDLDDHFQRLDLTLLFEWSGLDAAIKGILTRMRIDFQGSRFHESKYSTCLQVILANLLCVYTDNPKTWVGYSRYRNYYSKVRYNPHGIKPDVLLRTIEWMAAGGLVDHVIGEQVNPEKVRRKDRRISRLRARPELFELADLRLFSGNCQDEFSSDSETVRLKDQNGVLEEYNDTEETVRMRENLRQINNHLRKFSYEVDGAQLLPPRLYRVFNNSSWEHGGRFYSHSRYMSWSKIKRAGLLIEGAPTVEYDFCGIQPSLLYAGACLQIRGDPYDLGEKDFDRNLVKKAFTIALGTNGNKGSAVNALYRSNENLREDGVTRHFERKSLSTLYNLLLEKHEPIKGFLFRGIGLVLQCFDSKIAEEIMLSFVSRGLPILSIHDSFMVRDRDGETLQEVMRNAYRSLTGFEIQVKKVEPIWLRSAKPDTERAY